MIQIGWDQRLPGDVFLSDLSSLIGNAISEAERELHPNAPLGCFIPTHSGLIGPNNTVIEAWLDLDENSVAAVNSDSKYTPYIKQLQVWRPQTPKLLPAQSLPRYLKDYGPERYGWLNLVGFEYMALMEEIIGVRVDNPFNVSEVCSQGVMIYLSQRYAGEYSGVTVQEVRNADPLYLELLFLGVEAI